MEKGNWLLCDLHIHTRMSDGKLSLQEVIDLYGQAGFDCIAITDHILDELHRSYGKNVAPERFPEYLVSLHEAAKMAMNRYGMILLPGAELTNNAQKYHILGIDMKEYVDPGLSVPEIAWALHRQGALVIACHPHHTTNSREDTLYLWDHHRWLAGLFDAWEIANNEDLFTQVSLKGFNYLANSDFHEPHHLYSWKTIIKAEKSSEVIKAAIRENRGVAIYRYRNNHLPSRSRQILSSLNPSLTAT